jgi:hypothetical protein
MDDDFWQLLGGETLYFIKEDFTTVPDLEFEGENLKKVLIVYNNKWSVTDKELIIKILAAVKLTLNDVVLLQMDKQKTGNLESYIEFFESKFVLAFGLRESNLYQIVKEESQTFLYADSVPILSQDNTKKRDLWQALKKMF